MDETNDQETPAGDEAAEELSEASASAEEAPCCRKGRSSFAGGIISGVIAGHLLGLMLARRRGEERARRGMVESGTWEGGEGLEEEGHLPAMSAVERAQAIAAGVSSGIVAAWAAVRERLHEAVEEGKEGMAEGQEEARTRYEFMTKRRRPRR
jgi:gas vesicle protein